MHGLLSETTTEYAARILATLYERAEILIRLLWTFVLASGALATSETKLRGALRRWVVPMIV